MTELHKTWDDIASNWHRWAPPLRPCQEDLDLMYESLDIWWNTIEAKLSVPDIFVLGITPEIVTMKYPFHNHLVGMDIAENMVKEVWPGDIPAQRFGMVGDWFKLGEGFNMSRDVVLADGSFVFFDKDKRDKLARIVNKVLFPKSIFVGRFFVCDNKEPMKAVILDLQSGKLRNFHELKFRVGMSLQESSDKGVAQGEIYEAIKRIPRLEFNPAFSKSDLFTLEFYKGKEAKLYFPSSEEYINLFSKYFERVDLAYPRYQFGEYCPTITAVNPLLSV